MQRVNVEIVRDQYAATNERDFERVMSHYADDVELVVPPNLFLAGGMFTGKQAVGGWLGDWLSSFDRDARFDIREIRELGGEAILVVADHRARGRASGAEVRGTIIWLYRVRAGKIARIEGFESRDEALEAAAHQH
jgi:ketosteroid isomerase-like protein